MRYHLLRAGLIVLLLAPISWADEGKEPQVTEVPFQLTKTSHVLVRVKINDKGPFNFIIDTGAPALILNEAEAEGLGLEPDRKGWTKFDRLELEGGLVVPDAEGIVLDMFQLKGMNSLGLAGAKLHGVIGYNILAKYKIRYDFTADKLVFTDLDFDPPPITRIGGGGSQGGLEMIGTMMKWMGPLLGIRPNFERLPRGYLGVEIEENADRHVLITKVIDGSPAAKAGLQKGDRIRAAQRKDVDSVRDLMKALAATPEGESLRLLILRDGEEHIKRLKLGKGL